MAAKSLHQCGALSELEHMWAFTTWAVVRRTVRIYARLAPHCKGAVRPNTSLPTSVRRTLLKAKTKSETRRESLKTRARCVPTSSWRDELVLII
eukprot:7852129-Pyramimonas_sp.AAC.1